MNPNLNFKKFDHVILPKHDGEFCQKNVITCVGALGLVDKNLLKKEQEKFADVFDKIKSPKIALLVGGSSKKGNFTMGVANNLANICSKIVNEMGGHLLAVSSRRTGEDVENALEKNLKCPKTVFTWQGHKNNNPYFAILQNADFIIATGDSISMCCEICCLGKPVYIYNPSKICSQKHLEFHEGLFLGGFARKLEGNLTKLENYSPNILAETNRVAKKILEESSNQ
jgi:mitochondrial fission protein ELM1